MSMSYLIDGFYKIKSDVASLPRCDFLSFLRRSPLDKLKNNIFNVSDVMSSNANIKKTHQNVGKDFYTLIVEQA